jgi:hypothetical protein
MTNLINKFHKEWDWKPFTRYCVKLRLEDIVGGTPKSPDLIQGWIDATNKKKSDEQRAALVTATIEELDETSNEVVDKSAIGFKSDDKGLYIEGRCAKAMLKEVANIIRNIAPGKTKGKHVKGVTALKSKIADQSFIEERRIYLGREKPDEIEEKPIHVKTPRGKRTALKRIEICRDCEIAFHVLLRNGSEATEQTLLAILDYAQKSGLGADRSQGRGQFEVLSVEKVV